MTQRPLPRDQLPEGLEARIAARSTKRSAARSVPAQPGHSSMA